MEDFNFGGIWGFLRGFWIFFPWNLGVSGFPRKSQENSKEIPNKNSTEIPRIFQEKSAEVPGKFKEELEIPRKFHRNSREIPKPQGNSREIPRPSHPSLSPRSQIPEINSRHSEAALPSSVFIFYWEIPRIPGPGNGDLGKMGNLGEKI